jgi:predicted O-linked N-acetylglucosamine transferase (SPINDLY family)
MSEVLLQDALQLRRAGKITEAAEIYRALLRREPGHFEALHALGIISYQSGRIDEAERLIRQAVASNPNAAEAAYNHACLLQRMNRPEEALGAFDRALAVRPDYIEALVNRGGVLWMLKRYPEALANSERVVELRPDLAEAWNNHGGALQVADRFEEALVAYDRALAIKPAYLDAWKNRAILLTRLQRHEEALQATDKALELAPDSLDLLARRGDLLALQNRQEEAAAAYDRYLKLKPDDANAWYARGFALKLLNRRPESLACFERAVNLQPADARFRENRGNMLFEVERFEEAAQDYEALAVGPTPPTWLPGYLAICHLHCCDWRNLDAERVKISAGLEAGLFVIDPTGNAIISHSLAEQLQCARIWAADKYPPMAPPLWQPERSPREKIRVAYLSADFRAHATAFLMAGVFEHHDRSKFETLAISYSADDKSPMRARLEKSFDRFIDIRDQNDAEAAGLLRDLEIDIVVDLKGYTAEGRPGLLSQRIAPVQAHYLGFPGTMGVDYVDYLIADPIVIPREHRPLYSEQIAYLPDTYQCNDRQRQVVASVPTRSEAGLPDAGFVFCCFNNNHKITPEMFQIWMRLLSQVSGSVLWLLKDNDAVVRNLRREAAARGVAPERLVFAPRTDPQSHLARQSLADLFLDTQPYTAHTTASDALWMGLPLVTMLGSTFAGRVAASVLEAAAVPELVTYSLAEYETLALRLAREPATLGAIKGKLRAGRDTCALFDTGRFTRNLEAAFTAMWDRHRSGLPPATFLAGSASPP